MRHGVAGNKLGRNQKWREATIRDIAKATLLHQRIKTTKAKAAEARKLVDRLITMGKAGTLAAKRRAFAILCDHALVSQLFNTIAPRFAARKGGYTRIIKFALARRGDCAEMALLELTEKDEALLSTADGGSAIEEAQVVETKPKAVKKVAKPKAEKEDKGSKKSTKKE